MSVYVEHGFDTCIARRDAGSTHDRLPVEPYLPTRSETLRWRLVREAGNTVQHPANRDRPQSRPAP